MKVTIEAYRCDRCGTTQVPPDPVTTDYSGPKEYVIRQKDGGPVFHWCRPCYIDILNFVRGVK